MKDFIIKSFIGLAFLYLIFSITCASFDFAVWPEEGRFIFGLLGIFVLVIMGMRKYLEL